MALDYVKTLRDMEGGGQQEALQPRVKITLEQAAAQEANARSIDAENGRFGRYRDQQGKWATAWQAPGRSTPIVPPRFIAPAKLSRDQSRNLVLQPVDGDALLVSPQQWVVVYDGDGEAIVADDEDFRRVMTREDRVHVEPEEAEAEAAPEYHPAADPKNISSIPQPDLQPQRLVPTVSMDGFVAQVLSDNQRLRLELEVARRWAADQEQATIAAQKSASTWRDQSQKLAARGQWLWGHISRAMGFNVGQLTPTDAEVEAWLADAGRFYTENSLRAGNGQDPPPEVRQAVDTAAEADAISPEPTPTPPPPLNAGKGRRTPLKAGASDEAA